MDAVKDVLFEFARVGIAILDKGFKYLVFGLGVVTVEIRVYFKIDGVF